MPCPHLHDHSHNTVATLSSATPTHCVSHLFSLLPPTRLVIHGIILSAIHAMARHVCLFRHRRLLPHAFHLCFTYRASFPPPWGIQNKLRITTRALIFVHRACVFYPIPRFLFWVYNNLKQHFALLSNNYAKSVFICVTPLSQHPSAKRRYHYLSV